MTPDRWRSNLRANAIKSLVREARGKMNISRPIVFASWAERDDRGGSITRLIAQLREALARDDRHVEVFAADRLEPGSSWPEGLRQKLEAASVVMPILTPGYFASKFCREELKASLDRSVALLPVLFQDVPQLESDPAGDPLVARIASIKWVDLRGLASSPSLLDELAAAVLRRLFGRDSDAPAPTREASSPLVPQRNDLDEVVRIALEGDDDARVDLVRTLAGIETARAKATVERLAAELERLRPNMAQTHAAPGRMPEQRGWLLSLLGGLSRVYDPAIDEIAPYTRIEHEPDENVRFWAMSGAASPSPGRWLSLVKDRFADERPGPDRVLSLALLIVWKQQQVEMLQQMLDGSDDTKKWHVLRALRLVPLRDMVDAVCRFLSTSEPQPMDFDALLALAHPTIAQQAAEALEASLGVEGSVARIVGAAVGAKAHHTKLLALLLGALPAHQAALRKELASPDGARARGARPLARILGLDKQSLAKIDNDVSAGVDRLQIEAEVSALSRVLMSAEVEAPIAVGLFGDWGSGKTFFMARMRETIAKIETRAKNNDALPFCRRVVQIEFNAWHYMDANLWASLVSHIFEVLADKVTPKDSAHDKTALMRELKTAKKLKEEADAATRVAKKQLADAQAELAASVRTRETKEIELSDLRAEAFKALKARAKNATKIMQDLGIPEARQSLEAFEEAARDAWKTVGRLRENVVFFRQGGKAAVWLTVFLLACAGVAWGLPKLYPAFDQSPAWSTLKTVVSNLTVVLGAATVAVRAYVTRVDGYLRTFESARREATKLLEERRATKTRKEEELEQAVRKLAGDEEVARAKLTDASERVKDIERQILDVEEGRTLARFLEERVHGDDYRKQLGLIAVIRRDFENLDAILKQVHKPHGVDRIILYIDDLDRCRPEKVVEVLQAVHLLLSVPLFIVVVAVDSRWLKSSLEREYVALGGVPQTRGNPLVDGWYATPQMYLEKIFQIPYTLRTMDKDGYQGLVAALLNEGIEERPSSAVSVTDNTPEVRAKVAAGVAQVPLPVPRPANPQTPPRAAEPETVPQVTHPAESAGGEASPDEMNVSSLLITAWEVAFAKRLYPFMRTPRAVKRFANTFRLVKATVPVAELAEFEGTAESPGECRMVLLLLALQVGTPDDAARVFRDLAATKAAQAWRNQLDQVLRTLASAEDVAEFLASLGGFAPRDERSTFLKWLPGVARYSFDRAGADGESNSVDARSSVAWRAASRGGDGGAAVRPRPVDDGVSP